MQVTLHHQSVLVLLVEEVSKMTLSWVWLLFFTGDI